MLILIVQYNHKQDYKNTIIVLETTLGMQVGIVIIQKSFISIHEISHNAFNLYWPQVEKKEIRVITVIRKNLADKIMIKHKTDFINHPYFILLEIHELEP